MAYTGQNPLDSGNPITVYRHIDAIGYEGPRGVNDINPKHAEFKMIQEQFPSVQKAAAMVLFISEYGRLMEDLDGYVRQYTQPEWNDPVTPEQTAEFQRKGRIYDELTKLLKLMKADLDIAIAKDMKDRNFKTHAHPALEYFMGAYDVTSYPTVASIKKRRGMK